MGFWSSISSALDSINGSQSTKDSVENDATYQRYHNEIKKFDLKLAKAQTLTNHQSDAFKQAKKASQATAGKLNDIDRLDSIEDVKQYFEQTPH